MDTTNQDRARSVGYVIAFPGHGAFSPSGKIKMTAAEIAAHNAELAAKEVETLRATGRGLLYLDLSGTNDATQATVTNWPGTLRIPAYNVSVSWHNIAGPKGRTDCDFNFDGSRWHGVNIGDSQLLRVRRCKR